MTAKKAKCLRTWYTVVHLKERYCSYPHCGSPYGQAHHIILKSQGNMDVQLDQDFGIKLCEYHHEKAPDAPHVSPRRFEVEVLPRILMGMDPARAVKIRAFLNKPGALPTVKADFDAHLARLEGLIPGLIEDRALNADCEGRPERNWRYG